MLSLSPLLCTACPRQACFLRRGARRPLSLLGDLVACCSVHPPRIQNCNSGIDRKVCEGRGINIGFLYGLEPSEAGNSLSRRWSRWAPRPFRLPGGQTSRRSTPSQHRIRSTTPLDHPSVAFVSPPPMFLTPRQPQNPPKGSWSGGRPWPAHRQTIRNFALKGADLYGQLFCRLRLWREIRLGRSSGPLASSSSPHPTPET